MSSDLETILNGLAAQKYVLSLYVAGSTVKSSRAIGNIRKICEENLKDRYELEVIDVYQDDASAEAEQIIAAPTLVKRFPLPVKRLVGDFSDRERVFAGLNIPKT